MKKKLSFDPRIYDSPKQYDTSPQEKLLDMIAYFFAIKGPCAAAAYSDYSENIICLAYNALLNEDERVDFYKLSILLRDRDTTRVDLLVEILRTNYNFSSTLDRFIQVTKKNNDTLHQFAKALKICIVDGDDADLLDMYFKIKSYIETSEIILYGYGDFLKPMLAARTVSKILESRAELFKFVFIDNSTEMHAEVFLLKKVPISKEYIGVSIFSCPNCHDILMESGVRVKGMHTIVDSSGLKSHCLFDGTSPREENVDKHYSKFLSGDKPTHSDIATRYIPLPDSVSDRIDLQVQLLKTLAQIHEFTEGLVDFILGQYDYGEDFF
jgi:hypothetical protein